MIRDRRVRPRFAILLAAWLAATAPAALPHAVGPPLAHTGDFGESSCAQSSCHVGNAVNASGGSLALTGLPAQYEPGKTYTLTVTINRSGQSRWGFECSARQVSGGRQAGILAATDAQRTEVDTEAGIQYIHHNFLGALTGPGPKSWSFNWTAPATAVGAVRCSCAGNAANGNGTNTGDFIYTTTATTNPAAGLNFLTTLYFPRLVTTENDFTGIAVANLDSSDATLRFTSYDKSGSQLTSSPGVALTNPKELTLARNAQLPVVDTEVFGQGLTTRKPTGWFKIESTVRKIAGFFLMFDASLTVMDGADVGSQTLTSFVFPEVEDLGFTQLHVANPNAGATTLTLDLVAADGRTRSSVSRTVEANGALADPLSSLFPGIAPSGSDYVRVSASQGVVPFEYLGRTEQYGEGINGQDLGSAATTLYSPQYVVGGGIFRTALSIVNVDSSSGTITLRLIGDDGVQIGVTRSELIPAGGKVWITNQSYFVAAGGTLTQGYVEIKSSGPRLTGSVVFGDPDRTTFSASLPLVASLRSAMVFGQLASNSTFFTGLAILNPNGGTVNAAIDVYDASGNLVANTFQAIGPGKRVSQLLTQYFPGLVGQSYSRGYFRVATDRPVASFALFGTNNLSVLSAVPPQEVAP
jgi:hypothetical protein